MKYLSFKFIYAIIWVISKLPFSILYFLSDIFFYVLYYIVGYRKEVVKNNLRIAFPDKSEAELKLLTKKALKHFTDFIFESIKTFTISEKEIHRRFKYMNLELLNELEKEGKTIILMGTHYGNWEWIIYLAKHVSFLPVAAYTKISNQFLEKSVKTSREKFGGIFIRTSDFTKNVLQFKKDNKNAIYGLLSDQSPVFDRAKYWTNFLGAKVPVIVGSEELAKKHDFVVVNFNTHRVKRGFYEIEFEVLTKDPRSFENYEITEKFLALAEKHIRKQPEFYLWTHKRFKHAHRYDEWLELKNSTKNN